MQETLLVERDEVTKRLAALSSATVQRPVLAYFNFRGERRAREPRFCSAHVAVREGLSRWHAGGQYLQGTNHLVVPSLDAAGLEA